MDIANKSGSKHHRVIILDVEGVLLPKRRFLLFEAARKLSFLRFAKVGIIGILYETGLLSLESALRRIFKILRGVKIVDLFELYKKIPLISGVETVFRKLNELGYRTVLISSGLPTIFVEDLAIRLKADYAFGLEVEVTNGHLTGKIKGDVLKHKGKALVLKRIMEKDGLSPKDCAVVADDRNNLPMFPLCGLRVGYNPDFLLSAKSDFVVDGDLAEILPVITKEDLQAPIPKLSRRDIVRETIHITGLLVTFACQYLLNPLWVSSLILIVTLLYAISELARLEGIDFPILSAITWKATTEPELYEFTVAPIFFAIGIMLPLILFTPRISYASIAILTLGDGFATISGKIFGRTVLVFNKGKTLEGSVFGFFFALAGATVFVHPAQALIGALVGMFTECIPSPINDNISVPLMSGLALMSIS